MAFELEDVSGGIKKNTNKIKKLLKDKGVLVIVGVGGVFLVYKLLSSSSGGSGTVAEYVPVSSGGTSTDSGSASSNADNILSSLQGLLEKNNAELKEEMGQQSAEWDEKLLESNAAMNEALADSNKSFSEGLQSLNDSLAESNRSWSENLMQNNSNIESMNTKITESMNTVRDSINESNKGFQETVTEIKKQVDASSKNQNASSKKPTNTTTTTKPTANTTAKPATKSPVYAAPKKAGVSIVDNLKALGVNSSLANRKKLAAANGISNYTGTAAQNNALNSKLKAGTLKKV